MFRLKYKFKKILRFLNKLLRVILIFGCIASLLCFEASAAVYRNDDKFFEVFSNSSAWVTIDHNIDTEDYELSDPQKLAHVYYYTVPSSLRQLKFLRFYVYESFSNRIPEGNLVILKGSLLVRGSTTDGLVDYLVDNECSMSVLFTGSNKVFVMQKDIKPIEIRRTVDDKYYAEYEIDVSFTIPADLDYYENPAVEFLINFDGNGGGFTSSSIVNFYIGSDSLSLYVGDESSAPLYPEYDSGFAENIEGKEEIAFDEAGAGLSEAGSFISQFQNIFENGGPTVAGLMFVNMFMDDLSLNIPWIRILLVISLSLGVITIILGVFNVVKRGK